MKSRIFYALTVALAASLVGLSAYALARRAKSPRGFTVHAKTYMITPDGTQTEVSDETTYVSSSGDIRDIRRDTRTGEISDTIRLTSEGTVYRVGGAKLHYMGKWRNGPPPVVPPAPDSDTMLGYPVRWQVQDEGRIRMALAPGLQEKILYLSVTDRERTLTYVTEAYSVMEGEPPADVFAKPDKPVSRDWYESKEAKRAAQQARKN